MNTQIPDNPGVYWFYPVKQFGQLLPEYDRVFYFVTIFHSEHHYNGELIYTIKTMQMINTGKGYNYEISEGDFLDEYKFEGYWFPVVYPELPTE